MADAHTKYGVQCPVRMPPLRRRVRGDAADTVIDDSAAAVDDAFVVHLWQRQRPASASSATTSVSIFDYIDTIVPAAPPIESSPPSPPSQPVVVNASAAAAATPSTRPLHDLTGGSLWKGSALLALYIHVQAQSCGQRQQQQQQQQQMAASPSSSSSAPSSSLPSPSPPPDVLELGAGLGVCGLLAARHVQRHHHHHSTTSAAAPRCLLTDGDPSSVRLLQANIALNAVDGGGGDDSDGDATDGATEARLLLWDNQQHIDAVLRAYPRKFHVIFASDVIYGEHASQARQKADALLRTAAQLLRESPSSLPSPTSSLSSSSSCIFQSEDAASSSASPPAFYLVHTRRGNAADEWFPDIARACGLLCECVPLGGRHLVEEQKEAQSEAETTVIDDVDAGNDDTAAAAAVPPPLSVYDVTPPRLRHMYDVPMLWRFTKPASVSSSS